LSQETTSTVPQIKISGKCLSEDKHGGKITIYSPNVSPW
jgi:hypothetical protein